MRFVFKTAYDQDINLMKHEGYWWSYGFIAVLALAAPFLLGEFYTGELTQIFAFAVCGLGLMIATGFTGLVSLGHAAFMGIGAYAHGYFINDGIPGIFPDGVPWLLSVILSISITAAIGVLFAIPVLRMTGLYLAIATLAFAAICEELFTAWKDVTRGTDGMPFVEIDLFGWSIESTDVAFYYVLLALLVLAVLVTANLLRTPMGRAMIAIRDSEVSAQSMGVNLARTKIVVFGVSAAITGLGGIMFAHKITHVAPEAFNILQSITLLLMIVVGGMGSIHGAILGAALVSMLPTFISIAKDWFPSLQDIHTLPTGVFGLLLLLFIILEPLGVYGMWRKFKLYIDVFPLYRRRTFKRQKAFHKTERLR